MSLRDLVILACLMKGSRKKLKEHPRIGKSTPMMKSALPLASHFRASPRSVQVTERRVSWSWMENVDAKVELLLTKILEVVSIQ